MSCAGSHIYEIKERKRFDEKKATSRRWDYMNMHVILHGKCTVILKFWVCHVAKICIQKYDAIFAVILCGINEKSGEYCTYYNI